MSDDGLNTYTITCDVCGDNFPKTEEKTVAWANLSACSFGCKQRWQNAQRRHI